MLLDIAEALERKINELETRLAAVECHLELEAAEVA